MAAHETDPNNYQSWQVEPKGFAPANFLSVVTGNQFDLGRGLGRIMRPQAPHYLEPSAYGLLHRAIALANTETCVINGVNYLKHYLDQLNGFSQSTGMSLVKAASLQAEFTGGCQTLIIEDAADNRVGFIHAEEDAADEGMADNYGYRWVSAEVAGTHYQFFLYPSLCSGGSAMSINYRMGSLMLVDSINVAPKPGDNDLWANAVTAMMLQIGDIGGMRQLIHQMKLAQVTVHNAYAIHVIQAGNPPEVATFEIGGGVLTEVVYPHSLHDRRLRAQPNLAASTDLKALDRYTPPPVGVQWQDEKTAVVSREVVRRHRRLHLMGVLANISGLSREELLEKMRCLAANPYGDIESGLGGKSAFTGLPGWWNSAQMVGVVDMFGGRAEIHKGNVPPIAGKEYRFLGDPEEIGTLPHAREDLRRWAVDDMKRREGLGD